MGDIVDSHDATQRLTQRNQRDYIDSLHHLIYVKQSVRRLSRFIGCLRLGSTMKRRWSGKGEIVLEQRICSETLFLTRSGRGYRDQALWQREVLEVPQQPWLHERKRLHP